MQIDLFEYLFPKDLVLKRKGSNSYLMYRPSVQAKIKLWKMSSRQFNDASFHIELFINIFIIPRLRRAALQEGWHNGLKSMLKWYFEFNIIFTFCDIFDCQP